MKEIFIAAAIILGLVILFAVELNQERQRTAEAVRELQAMARDRSHLKVRIADLQMENRMLTHQQETLGKAYFEAMEENRKLKGQAR